MPNLKLAYVKRSLKEGENPASFLEALKMFKTVLLESAVGGRFSYIGYDPFAYVTSKEGHAQMTVLRDFANWKKTGGISVRHGTSYEALKYYVQYYSFGGKAPVPFTGGVGGFFSYDFGCKLIGVEQKVFDDLGLPEYAFYFFDKVVVFDHDLGELYYCANAPTNMEAERKLKQMQSESKESDMLQRAGDIGPITSNLSKEKYFQKIDEIKKYLADGETYQVNFSQRFMADCSLDPWRVYLNLRRINPSPYGCYFDFDDYQIVSCSPELLCEKMGNLVRTRPIKGTVKRGKSTADDKKQIDKLLSSVKDQAELAMIVDLERNDLGKVCDFGTVKVIEHRKVEKYAHVIHTVSTIEGKLKAGKDFFDTFEAVFPGGSITGCPKTRTIEIIDRLEDFRRGIYTGSAGFIGFDGNAVMNILIRTVLFKCGKMYYQVGGGIVMDSVALDEYKETLDKAESLRLALEV